MNLFSLLTEPDSYEDRPMGYAQNQAGHMLVGAGLSIFLPVWVILGFYAAWEGTQVRCFGASVHDAVEDFAFVLTGALALAEPTFAAVGGVFLLGGVARRFIARGENHG